MSQKSGAWGLGLGSKRESKTDPKQLPPYHVVLLNDNEHTYEYVIRLLNTVFSYPEHKGFQLAKKVDEANRAIVFTTHKELAELKREQIQSFGVDPRISSCKGSMTAIIEQA